MPEKKKVLLKRGNEERTLIFRRCNNEMLHFCDLLSISYDFHHDRSRKLDIEYYLTVHFSSVVRKHKSPT